MAESARSRPQPQRQPPAASRQRLQWAVSRTRGGVSEIAVLSPIRRGLVPGERRTYEERARAVIANLARRHEQGIPTELDQVPTIHFGRIIVIRPEHYLQLSKFRPGSGVIYVDVDDEDRRDVDTDGGSGIPADIDDFVEVESQDAKPEPNPELRSLILTLVEFDGDLKVYMRDIAGFLAESFDNIFENCEFYPGTADFERFWLWIRRFQIPTDLFYATYPGLSVARIRYLEAFKRRFDKFVLKVRSPTGATVGSMDEMFDEFLRQNQQYAVGFPSPAGIYAGGEDEHS